MREGYDSPRGPDQPRREAYSGGVLGRTTIAVALVSTLLGAQMNYFASGDRALSAFVTGQYLIWQPGEIGLLVLWRGGSRFWYAGSRSGGGSGTAHGYTGSVRFGSQQFDFLYDKAGRVARVRSTEVSLAQGENVLLIDGADRDGEPLIRAIKSDLSYEVTAGRGSPPSRIGNDEIAAILGRSADIVAFLRCGDDAADRIATQASLFVCGDLKSK